jgi:hypothetical protein
MFAFNFQKVISVSILLGINSANRVVIRNRENNIQLVPTTMTVDSTLIYSTCLEGLAMRSDHDTKPLQLTASVL